MVGHGLSGQCGAMVLLKRLQENGEIRLDYARPDVPVPQPAATAFSRVTADPTSGAFPREDEPIGVADWRGRFKRS